ncbi:sugar phosphate isomerase/epimerase [Paenibacillus sp. MSJ-34]|uniref:sugar phosphate isomerase/epimerase family protein n=1 Tax=Paenibacillus sp. MSJ-34 TaxID=2841529 RepID=UPI001C0FC1E2|nr:sugar phosphate isomerase/epimerase family protein [Paenibacillus sp. MSJ-34]MBU5442882.1 sugar phosphate isomerase/epimerase [Paenibacillus sp. MSJ-34]
MKISLSIWSVHDYIDRKVMDNVSFIDFAGTTKAQGVELLSAYWRDPDKEVPLVQEALKRNGLELACFGACNNLAVADPRKHREQVRDILDSIDMAQRLGANVVRVFSGDQERGSTFDAAMRRIIDGLREAAAYAEAKGIVLCLENHGLFAGKAGQVLEIIREVDSPALRSTFDTGNFLLVDEDPNEALSELIDYISHVHFKDFLPVDDEQGGVYVSVSGRRFVGKVSGEGIVDLEHILQVLKDKSYDGWLTVEYEGSEEQKEGTIRSIERMQAILGSL